VVYCRCQIDRGFHGCDGSRRIDPKKSVASVRSVVYPIRKVPSRVIHENIKKFMDGFYYNAHPMGMKSLLTDLSALERMIETDRIESGVRRIGAEQEMFLVDGGLRPAPVATAVLARAAEPRLTERLESSIAAAAVIGFSIPVTARPIPSVL
jgi:hypothetical protein